MSGLQADRCLARHTGSKQGPQDGKSSVIRSPCRGSYRILSLKGDTLKFGVDTCPPRNFLDATYSHSKVISTCTEHSRVMLNFGCKNSWGGGG